MGETHQYSQRRIQVIPGGLLGLNPPPWTSEINGFHVQTGSDYFTPCAAEADMFKSICKETTPTIIYLLKRR